MIVLKYDAFWKHNKLNESEDSQSDPKNALREEVKSDVKRCVALILARYPFFGEYLIECRFLYDHPAIDTMATDGKNIFINSQFAAKLDDDQMTFILCHEILHIMLLHHLRMENKGAEPKRWNYAADYEINPMLVGEGLLTADQVKNEIKGLYDEKYLKKAAEVIYDELPESAEQDPTPGSGDWPVNVGDVIKTKDGKWGKITQIGANGTFDAEEITPEEGKKILKQKGSAV
jgi:predicted metal-dependent peptidase